MDLEELPDLRDIASMASTPDKDVVIALRAAQLSEEGTRADKRKRLEEALVIPEEQLVKLRFKCSTFSRMQMLRALQLRGLSVAGGVKACRERLSAHVKASPEIERAAKRSARAQKQTGVDLFGANKTPSVGAIRDTLLRAGTVPDDDEATLRRQYESYLVELHSEVVDVSEQEDREETDPTDWSTAELRAFLEERGLLTLTG